MLISTLDLDNIESLNTVIKERNDLSVLNRYGERDFTKESLDALSRIGMLDMEGNLLNEMKPTIQLLSNPYAVMKVMFTGGVGTYEHNINYDPSFHHHVSFTVTPGSFSIDDETNPMSIVKVLEDFVGKSNLKSINLSSKFDTTQALVIAAVVDMERRLSLRAFVDELPMIHNSYSTNMIWRIINSTSSSIQWFVSIVNEVIGEHVALSLWQVQEAVEQLTEKGVLLQNNRQYKLAGDIASLPGRMIIVDNVLSVQIAKKNATDAVVSSGFTCVQAGVHDLLLIDYNGKEMVFETITSVRLLNYMERFLSCEDSFAKLDA
ncbi:MAG: hypothetical protein K0S76_664 [Herbinix sp.]|jgi:hypothetical protein|nr:hypothetical protein [Herbinix sp.]